MQRTETSAKDEELLAFLVLLSACLAEVRHPPWSKRQNRNLTPLFSFRVSRSREARFLFLTTLHVAQKLITSVKQKIDDAMRLARRDLRIDPPLPKLFSLRPLFAASSIV